jgi:PilZ domain-containing protein
LTAAYIRHDRRIPVRLSGEFHVGDRMVTVVTRNLSIGGACIEGALSLPEGAALTVGLFLVVDDVEDATRPPLEVAGTVAWTTADGSDRSLLGVRFERLSQLQIEGLSKFLTDVGPE